MTWLIGGLCIFVAAMLLGRWFMQADPRVLARVLRWSALGAGLALALFVLLSGRFALLLPVALLALPFLRRWLTQGRMWPRSNPTPGQTSSVDTGYLEMTLDHDSGHMAGRIKHGAFAGRRLEELALDELLALLEECASADPEAAQLVEAYLQPQRSTMDLFAVFEIDESTHFCAAACILTCAEGASVCAFTK